MDKVLNWIQLNMYVNIHGLNSINLFKVFHLNLFNLMIPTYPIYALTDSIILLSMELAYMEIVFWT